MKHFHALQSWSFEVVTIEKYLGFNENLNFP